MDFNEFSSGSIWIDRQLHTFAFVKNYLIPITVRNLNGNTNRFHQWYPFSLFYLFTTPSILEPFGK